MQIDIQARGFQLTDTLRNHTERVLVWLSDINDPRGGADKL